MVEILHVYLKKIHNTKLQFIIAGKTKKKKLNGNGKK
jgi:hypothetical protein